MSVIAEAESKADFGSIRYAQCWEDADTMLAALQVQPGARCLSIASAGDNALALLASSPERVVAVDLSFPQIALVHLRVAAYRNLSHSEMLSFLGFKPSPDRATQYARLTSGLPATARAYWDAHIELIDRGVASSGKFEQYFRLFRERLLPLVHDKSTVAALLAPKSRDAREQFYDRHWNSLRWRLMFRVFFSRFVMGRLGRDPAFFDYVEGPVSERLIQRARHALVELDPSENSYLQRILLGEYAPSLPFALRAENFDVIRQNLDRLEVVHGSMESHLDVTGSSRFDRFNLSDIFEYMSEAHYVELLQKLVAASIPGARLLYWNMLAPRTRPEKLSDVLRPLSNIAARLHASDKAFFYSRIVLEEVI